MGSGKTVLHGLDILERGRSETEGLGGVFTNTQATLEKGVLVEIEKVLELAGYPREGSHRFVFDRRPPARWFQRWARKGIEIPRLARYRNVMTAPNGVHVLCGTLHNQSYHQFETIQFHWIRIEEAINNSLAAINTMLERVRCSTGGGDRCRKFHRHTRHLIFNPPSGAHPWLKAFLTQLEESAKDHYHALQAGDECECPRVHGPELAHGTFPLLQAGIGDAILIRSRTSDNAGNLDDHYESGLASRMSKATARKRLDGEISFETEGRTYVDWSTENIRPVRYDADRTLFLALDFNLFPRAAVFAHPLNPGAGEYPTEHERVGVSHLGAFGEYMHAGEMSDRHFALELVRGGRGAGCDLQMRYRSEELRGLPPACDETCEGYEAALGYSRTCRRGHWNGLRAHRGRIVGYGDQRGTHRSSHGDNLESSWDIVNQVFRQLPNYSVDVPEDQPSPRARVDAVNGKLCSALDVRSLWVDSRCEELIRDAEQVQWDETGSAEREWRQGTEVLRTHLIQALGYCVARRYPLGTEIDPVAEVPRVIRGKRRRSSGGGI
ncbi:MAG: hypothetical protein WA208_00765 [Thermoanaerobaculia bacterium]